MMQISLLKIDIEGAEAIIFAHNYSWITELVRLQLSFTTNIDIWKRLPDFFLAISGLDFEVSRSGELTICKRRSRSLSNPIDR